MGPKGIGDMQAAKRDKMRHLRRYTDLSVMGVRVAALLKKLALRKKLRNLYAKSQ